MISSLLDEIVMIMNVQCTNYWFVYGTRELILKDDFFVDNKNNKKQITIGIILTLLRLLRSFIFNEASLKMIM